MAGLVYGTGLILLVCMFVVRQSIESSKVKKACENWIKGIVLVLSLYTLLLLDVFDFAFNSMLATLN